MPRRSPYKILLDDKEERQLEALARKYTSLGRLHRFSMNRSSC